MLDQPYVHPVNVHGALPDHVYPNTYQYYVHRCMRPLLSARLTDKTRVFVRSINQQILEGKTLSDRQLSVMSSIIAQYL